MWSAPMRWIMKNLIVVSAVAMLAGLSCPATAQPAPDAGTTKPEIRIGNVMPYTGALAAFGSIGKTEAAYFNMINERGGINGRKVKSTRTGRTRKATGSRLGTGCRGSADRIVR